MEPSARYPRICATVSSWRIKIAYSRGLRIRLLVLQTAKNSRIRSSFEAASAPACLMASITRDEVFFSKYECKKKLCVEVFAPAWWCHQEKEFLRYKVTLLHSRHPVIDGCVSKKFLHCRRRVSWPTHLSHTQNHWYNFPEQHTS